LIIKQLTSSFVVAQQSTVNGQRIPLIVMKEKARRSKSLIHAILALTLLVSACGPPPPVKETLPERLTDKEFWDLITDFSEPGGYFRSDNFLSNESGYQTIIPKLRQKLKPGGVYIGVGPEQNFTYVVALQPKIAFIVDIRRQNMLEHLFYKALMETSEDRAEFLSRLFAHPHRVELTANAAPEALFRAYESDRASSSFTFFEKNLKSVVDYLENHKGFNLSTEDESGIRNVAQAFFKSGPALSYTFIGGYGAYMSMPSYSELMTETDGDLRNWNFLANEDQFRMIQNMEKGNLIVPLVGDFAGPKAIRSVGRYIKDHGSTVRAFYTSNVEQYLFQDEKWQRFYDNVAFLPADSTSTFIRYSLSGWRFGHAQTSLTSGIWSTMGAYRFDRIKDYYDVIALSR
jgi:hypothetical protein